MEAISRSAGTGARFVSELAAAEDSTAETSIGGRASAPVTGGRRIASTHVADWNRRTQTAAAGRSGGRRMLGSSIAGNGKMRPRGGARAEGGVQSTARENLGQPPRSALDDHLRQVPAPIEQRPRRGQESEPAAAHDRVLDVDHHRVEE